MGDGGLRVLQVDPDELTRYLLVPRLRKDNAGFLAGAGNTIDNWRRLLADLLEHGSIAQMGLDGESEWGSFLVADGSLEGPNGTTFDIHKVWIRPRGQRHAAFLALEARRVGRRNPEANDYGRNE